MTTADPDHARRRRTTVTIGLLVVLAAVVITFLVVGKSGDKVLTGGGDTKILVGKRTDEGMTALGSGTLADVGGCLGWAPTNGADDGTVVIWPHGTNIERPDPLLVRIDGKDYAIGDTVEVGGGEIGPLARSSYFYDLVPKACRASNVFLANAG